MDLQEWKFDPMGIIFSDSSSEDEENRADRKYAVRPYYLDRENTGAFTVVFNELARTDSKIFYNYSRMTLSEFEELLRMVAPIIIKQTVLKEPLSPAFRLAITLR